MNIKIAKYTLLAAVISLASCKNDDDDGMALQQPSPTAGTMTFAASFETPLSKATVENNKTTTFKSGDAISIFSGTENNKFSTTGSGATATFTGTATKSTSGYYALFPYSSSATIADKVITTQISATQTGSAVDVVAVAFANADASEFALRNVNSLIYVKTQQTCSKIIVEASKDIVGNFKINIGADGTPSATLINASKVVTLTNAPNGGYISVLPVDGVDLKITYTISGKDETVTYKNVDLKRSEIIDFGTIDKLVKITFNVKKIEGATAAELLKKPGAIELPSSIGENINFNGWYDALGNAYAGGTSVTITKNTDFTVLASDEKILVLNGAKTQPFVVVKGGKATLPSDVQLTEGQEFKGWSFKQNATQDADIIAAGEADVSAALEGVLSKTIYAITPRKMFTITLDAKEGQFQDGDKTKTVRILYGESLDLTEHIPERDGYKFKGWDGDPTYIKSDITLTPTWVEYITLALTYHDFAGDVKATDENKKCIEGEKNPFTIKKDIELPYTVKTWTDGNGKSYTPGETYDFDKNTDLYPVAAITLTYHDFDGNVIEGKTQELTFTGQPVNVTLLAKDDVELPFAIASWNTQADGKGNTYELGSEQQLDKDVHLYPVKVVHTITYYDFEGKEVGTEQVKDGDNLEKIKTFKFKYKVDSWNTQIDGNGEKYELGGKITNVKSNIELYAIKSKNQPSGISDWDINTDLFNNH